MIESWLLGATITTITSLIAFGLVLFYFDPQNSGWLGLTLLLSTFICALLGTLTIFGYRLRERLGRSTAGALWQSLRQAGLLSGASLGLMLLAWFGLYRGWMMLAMAVVLICIEIYLQIGLKYKKPHKQTTGADSSHDGI